MYEYKLSGPKKNMGSQMDSKKKDKEITP